MGLQGGLHQFNSTRPGVSYLPAVPFKTPEWKVGQLAVRWWILPTCVLLALALIKCSDPSELCASANQTYDLIS